MHSFSQLLQTHLLLHTDAAAQNTNRSCAMSMCDSTLSYQLFSEMEKNFKFTIDQVVRNLTAALWIPVLNWSWVLRTVFEIALARREALASALAGHNSKFK